uniref:Uncharacterized protein n=1 Tax=Acrobeloides nanus TaxID=290746 RepID=A0A914C1H1_9BILA
MAVKQPLFYEIVIILVFTESSNSNSLPNIDSSSYSREKVITVYEKKKPITLKVIIKEVCSTNQENRKFDFYAYRMDKQMEIYHMAFYNCHSHIGFNFRHAFQKRKMAMQRVLPDLFNRILDETNLVIKAKFTPVLIDFMAQEGLLLLNLIDLDGKKLILPFYKLKKQSRRLFLEVQELNKKVDNLKALISQKIEKISLLEAEKRQNEEREAQTILTLQVELHELKMSRSLNGDVNSLSRDLGNFTSGVEEKETAGLL